MSFHANKFNQSHCNHCADKFSQLKYYNQGLPGTVNEPTLGPVIRSAWGGVGFASENKAYQNEGGYATLHQAYPGYASGCNPKNSNLSGCCN